MVCLYCQSPTRVANSRPQKRTNSIWRRRVCTSCEAVFTTEEKPTFTSSLLVTKDKESVPFSRDKLFTSIYESCRHRNDSIEAASSLTDTVIKQLLSRIESAALPKSAIVEVTAKALHRFDNAAGVQYAAYHKQ